MQITDQLPPDVLNKLHSHSEELKQFSQECKTRLSKYSYLKKFLFGLVKGEGVKQYDWLPGYFVKYHITRYSNAKLCQKCIDEKKLDLLGVATKYLYHIPGRSQALHDENYVVISQAIISDNSDYRLSEKAAQQFITLYNETGIYDFHNLNIIKSQGKYYIIDTGTLHNSWWKRLLAQILNPVFLTRHIDTLFHHKLEEETASYLINQQKSFRPKVFKFVSLQQHAKIFGYGLLFGVSIHFFKNWQ